jgi:hypothetical protein
VELVTRHAQRTKGVEKKNDRKRCFMVWGPAVYDWIEKYEILTRGHPFGEKASKKQR